jgi:hypothetical protein
MAIDFQHSKQLTLIQPAAESSLQPKNKDHRQPLHPRLACIIEETLSVRKTNEYMRQASGNQRKVLFIPVILINNHMIHILPFPAAMC